MSKYIIAYEALCPSDKISQNDPRRPAIIAEMRSIDKATTLPQAAQAVAWWNAWPNDQHATAEDFCREVKCLLASLREKKAGVLNTALERHAP